VEAAHAMDISTNHHSRRQIYYVLSKIVAAAKKFDEFFDECQSKLKPAEFLLQQQYSCNIKINIMNFAAHFLVFKLSI